MSERNERLFPELEPPPGGTTRLMARLDEAERGWRARARLLGAAGGLAVATAALLLVVNPFAAGYGALDAAWREAPGMSALGLGARQAEPVEISSGQRAGMVAVRVPVDAPGVIFYRVSALAD